MRCRVVILFAAAMLALSLGCGDQRARRAEADARRAAAEAEDARSREEAAARREAQRLSALWRYQETAPGKMHQVTAAVSSTNDVDTDGSGAKPVRLIFRDHESWGRSAYLVLQAGDFDCYGRCTVQVTVDGATPRPMAGRRPPTDEAIAMFVNDWRMLWGLTRDAKRIQIEFPVKAGGTRTAIFDVVGLDRSKMPGWDGSEARDATAGVRTRPG
ncbi:MAG TPA: hypothetical protein PLH72_00740 [Vicinamibacterales bacterium]|nr:hypothetical protein [Vicinamibacterales bacterium]